MKSNYNKIISCTKVTKNHIKTNNNTEIMHILTIYTLQINKLYAYSLSLFSCFLVHQALFKSNFYHTYFCISLLQNNTLKCIFITDNTSDQNCILLI